MEKGGQSLEGEMERKNPLPNEIWHHIGSPTVIPAMSERSRPRKSNVRISH